MAATKVLVVEDERDIADLMMLHLKREGCEVTVAPDGEQASQILQAGETSGVFNLYILDWMLPGKTGLDLLSELRKNPKTLQSPVLMVTAKASPEDVVKGLDAGADDYLVKPFEVGVFLARVRALLRRSLKDSNKNSQNSDLAGTKTDSVTIDNLKVYPDRFEVFCDGESIKLTLSEFKLLMALVDNRGKVLTRDKLIDLVQGEGVSVIDRAIDTHVFGLRKKLGLCADVIETVRGVGYRVKPEVN